jgi:hypothetical protein
MIETQNTNFTIKEQVDFIINLTHDEFLESVIMGSADEYQEWAEFCAQCITKLMVVPVPEPRRGDS